MKLPISLFSFAALYGTSKPFVTAQDPLTFGYDVAIDNTKITGNTPSIKFCARVETVFMGLDDVPTTVAFQETRYNISYDLTNNSFTVGTTTVMDEIRDVEETTNIIFDIEACQCNATSFACTPATDIQHVFQDEWLHVCIKPTVTNVNITNLSLNLVNPAINGFQYKPIDFGSGTWRHDNLTEVDVGMTEGIDVVRAKVFLVERLFEEGDSVVISGNAFLAVKNTERRKLEFEEFNLVVPFEEVSDSEKKKSFVKTTFWLSGLILIISILSLIYTLVSI